MPYNESMRFITYTFVAMFLVGAVLGLWGGALMSLAMAALCYWGEKAITKAPLVIGDGILERCQNHARETGIECDEK